MSEYMTESEAIESESEAINNSNNILMMYLSQV